MAHQRKQLRAENCPAPTLQTWSGFCPPPPGRGRYSRPICPGQGTCSSRSARLGGFLSCPGHTVHEANSAPACMEVVEQAPPDLVLLDLVMPHADGFELHQRLKAHPSIGSS